MKARSRITVSAALTLFLASAVFAQQTDSDGADRTSSTVSSTNTGKESWVRQAGDFVPMTRSERVADYVYSLVGPQAFLYSAAQSGFNQLRDTPQEWGQGAEGMDGDTAAPMLST